MTGNSYRFTTHGRKITRAGELSWGGNDGWKSELDQTEGVLIENGSVSPATGPDLSDGLISHWTMEARSGDTVTDFQNGLNGVRNGPAWTTNSKVGASALSFDGANDNVRIPDDPLLSIRTGFTVSFWARYDAMGNYEPTFLKDIGPNTRFDLSKRSSDVFGLTLADGSVSTDFDSVMSVQADTWYLVTVTYDDPDWILYVNGEFDNRGTFAGADGLDVATDIRFGLRARTGQNSAVTLDDVRIYNRVLSEQDMQALFEGAE